MNEHLVMSDEDVREELRALALAAVPSLRTPRDLADRVLSRTQGRRRRTGRRAIIAAGASVAIVVAAASRPGSGSHSSIIEPSAAMSPTIEVGEQVVFHKRLEPRRGDVVYARITVPGFDHRTISRVVAVAGDTSRQAAQERYEDLSAPAGGGRRPGVTLWEGTRPPGRGP